MKKRKNYKKYILISFFGIIVIFSIYFFLTNNNHLFNKLKSFSALTLINNKDNVKSNDLLESEINDLKKEIEELKGITNVDNLLTDKKIINASIIKRSDKYWFNMITINKGSKDGVKKGYPVITPSGLIGEVSIVNKNSSEIKLISSNNKNYISAKFTIDNKEYYGIIKEYNTIKNELYLENVIGDINNYKDISVVTSGLSNKYPSGLYIGKIIDIKKDKFNLSSTVFIRPGADLNDINMVMVVGND